LKYFILTFTLLVIISSCASLNKEECQRADWQALGLIDGSKGLRDPKNETYQKDCSEYGVVVDDKAYLEAFDEGLKKYCTYNNGLDSGLSGSRSHSKCESMSADFKRGYQEGYKEYKVAQAKKKAKVELREEMLKAAGGKECTSLYDCKREGSCDFGTCRESGTSCSFNSDCVLYSSCIPKTKYTDFNESITVRMCNKY